MAALSILSFEKGVHHSPSEFRGEEGCVEPSSQRSTLAADGVKQPVCNDCAMLGRSFWTLSGRIDARIEESPRATSAPRRTSSIVGCWPFLSSVGNPIVRHNRLNTQNPIGASPAGSSQ